VEKSIDWKKVKKIGEIVSNVLIWAFVAFSALITIMVFSAQGSSDGIPALFGKSWLTIQTPSMQDTYMVGDLVFMKKLSDEDKLQLAEDNIITYRAPIDIDEDGITGDINTHRIYKIDHATGVIITKGDNNILPDNEGDTPYTIHRNDVIGICTEDEKLSGVGNVINFLRSSLGFFLCIVLPLILFFLYELYNFISLILKERAKAAPAGVVDSATEEEIKRRAVEEYIRQQQLAAQGTAPVAEASAEESAVAPEAENLETTEETSKDGE
jgi:signal peptidase